jgi:hypothetical protein
VALYQRATREIQNSLSLYPGGILKLPSYQAPLISAMLDVGGFVLRGTRLFVNSRARFVRVVRVSPVCISVLVAITVHLLP